MTSSNENHMNQYAGHDSSKEYYEETYYQPGDKVLIDWVGINKPRFPHAGFVVECASHLQVYRIQVKKSFSRELLVLPYTKKEIDSLIMRKIV